MVGVRLSLTDLSPKPRTRPMRSAGGRAAPVSPSGAALFAGRRGERRCTRSRRRGARLPARRAPRLRRPLGPASRRRRPRARRRQWQRQDEPDTHPCDPARTGRRPSAVGQRTGRRRSRRPSRAPCLCRSSGRRQTGPQPARDAALLGGSARPAAGPRGAAHCRGAGRLCARGGRRLAVPLAVGRAAAAPFARPAGRGARRDLAAGRADERPRPRQSGPARSAHRRPPPCRRARRRGDPSAAGHRRGGASQARRFRRRSRRRLRARGPLRMAAFVGLFRHDFGLALRQGGDTGLVLGFFVLVVVLFAFGVGPEAATLRRIGPGIIWLAALLSLDRLFQSDYEDGGLDLLALADLPLAFGVLAKTAAYWAATGLPLVAISPLLALAVDLDAAAIPRLVLSLLIGTPALSLIGSVAAALVLGARRQGVLLSLLVLPLYVPPLIFGVGAVGADAGGANLMLLGALSLAALALCPWASAAALRQALE